MWCRKGCEDFSAKAEIPQDNEGGKLDHTYEKMEVLKQGSTCVE